jgi:CubicO group peptidase (beta-lactamase class C family)
MIYKCFITILLERIKEILEMKRGVGTLLVIITSLFVCMGCAAAPKKPLSIQMGDYEHTKKYMSWLIQQETKKHHVQGLSIAMVDDQQIIWAQGFGYADVNRKIPATPETVYPAGSIGKLFTIIAALQLAEQGKIELDQPLQTYLPEFSIKTRFPKAGPITPRNIMTHHSGLPSDWLKGMMSRNPILFTDLVKGIKDEYAAYPPNFVFSYSNLALRLLGCMVERVSGQAFVSYMDESVLQPMGMTHASFALTPDLRPLLSKGYKDGKETRDDLLRDLPSPEGPLYASATDLSRFIQMVFAHGTVGDQIILKPETLAEIFRSQNSHVPLDLDFRIGLGWFLNDPDIQNAGRVASHGGALSLFYSKLILLPEHKLGVVVLANSSAALDVVNKVAEEALKLALEAKTGITQPRMEKPLREPILPWSQRVLKDYEGQYATGFRVYTVSTRGEGLHTRLMGKPVQLVPHGIGLFSVQYRLFGIFPIHVKQLDGLTFSLTRIAGRDVLVLHDNGKKYLLGERIEPSPIPDAWLKRLGDYELVNPGDYFPMIEKAQLKYEDHLLTLDVTTPMLSNVGIERLRFAVGPVSNTEAVILGLGRNMGETIEAVTETGEVRLRYSGCEFRRKSE